LNKTKEKIKRNKEEKMRNNKLTIIKISIISVILMFLEIKNTYASFNVQSITTEISDRRIYSF
jgi:hypothetical protein